MVLTVKDLITTSNIHDLKVICGKEEMNREIKGIKIIEVENIEKYLRGGVNSRKFSCLSRLYKFSI
ncbi:hypothetical protein [Faecalibacillus faecis]|uniref:hypothetical protein n=1 Tax=Faecalibacillus faecis TaxID=1982628 RepID=UPI0022DFFC95|nr:hypothetical protein [Faecalibacillus faecis]